MATFSVQLTRLAFPRLLLVTKILRSFVKGWDYHSDPIMLDLMSIERCLGGPRGDFVGNRSMRAGQGTYRKSLDLLLTLTSSNVVMIIFKSK